MIASREVAARRKSVLVFGAGLAGLAAAYELKRSGHNVTVLEAKTHPGGRAMTLRAPFADGLHAEAGAKFVPENHDLTMGYARGFGLELARVNQSKTASDRSAIYHLRGKWIHVQNGRLLSATGRQVDWPLRLSRGERGMQPLELMLWYASPVCDDTALFGNPAQTCWPPKRLREAYDGLTFAQFLTQRGASESAISLMRLTYMSLAGDGIETLNALWALRELYFVKRMGTAFWLVNGTSSLPEAFAHELAGEIRYGAPVVRIAQRRNRVYAGYRNSGELRTLTADYAVCALPFPVLRNIEVATPFSEAKRRAIAELPYTSAIGVFLQTRTRFWETTILPRVAETDLPITYVLDTSWYQPGTRGMLMCLTAGSPGRALAALDEAERQAAVLAQMEKLYPGVRDEYEGGTSYSWDRDPWALGAYSWMRPGQMTSLQPHVATPEGRIHFAGDHTSAQPGWMQGALASGRRAAAAIMAAD